MMFSFTLEQIHRKDSIADIFTNVLTMDALQRKGGYYGKVEGLFCFCWSSSLADRRKSHTGTSDGGIGKKV